MSMQTLDALTTRTRVARVNLLPPEIGEARRFKRVQAGLALALVGVVGAAAGAYALTLGHVGTATTALEAEQAKTAALTAEQAQYAEVPQVLAEVQAVQRLSQDVTAYDVAWYSYLDAVATKAPEGVSLSSLSFSVAPVGAVDATAAAATTEVAPDGLSAPGVGSVNISGQTTSQALVASWMEQLGSIPGCADPVLSSSTLTEDTGVISFTTSATVTDSALLAQQ